MTTATPTYLACEQADSKKFYVVVQLPGDTRSVVGFGQLDGGGRWDEYDADYGRKAVAQRDGRKGYERCPHSKLSQAAIDRMLDTVRKATGHNCDLRQDGGIEIRDGGSPASGPKAAAPKRPRGRDRINVWI